MDERESKALRDIETHGCHILQVMAEGNLPPFSYSIGIYKCLKKPELLVIGLREELAAFVINAYNARLRTGESFQPGNLYSGFLEGFDCIFETVAQLHFKEYLGWARWLYQGDQFEVAQFIYPSTKGVWPWDHGAPEAFAIRQPILSEGGVPSFRP